MRNILLTVPLVFTIACTTSPPQGHQRALPNTGEPALHGVQDTRLRELMAEMNSLMFDRIRTALDIDQERRRRARQIADVAQELTGNADSILATAPTLNLTTGDRAAFSALAEKLRDQAKQLEERARRNDIDAIPQALDQMTHTCTACHQLFRSPIP